MVITVPLEPHSLKNTRLLLFPASLGCELLERGRGREEIKMLEAFAAETQLVPGKQEIIITPIITQIFSDDVSPPTYHINPFIHGTIRKWNKY